MNPYYTLLDGKKTALTILEELENATNSLSDSNLSKPHLAAILVGKNPASQTYVGAKIKACEKIGFESSLHELDSKTSEKTLLELIDRLNKDAAVNGFIIQLPLPSHIDEQKIIQAIDPQKDVDGFHPVNLGKMLLGLDGFVSATPKGIMELLKRHQISTEGKHAVVVGRSHIVGSPMSVLLAQKSYPGNCTVTLCHSRTKNIGDITKMADILIVALGKEAFIGADMVKEGAVVIDVGIHRVKDASKKSGYKLCGDVNFEEVSLKSSYISPVPGGVGPMTIASLMQNTHQAWKQQNNI